MHWESCDQLFDVRSDSGKASRDNYTTFFAAVGHKQDRTLLFLAENGVIGLIFTFTVRFSSSNSLFCFFSNFGKEFNAVIGSSNNTDVL